MLTVTVIGKLATSYS